ncbi:unnamed protein product [Dimorphilus gyrociliatus]|uniref:Uncharacterized protein n=1 Tax=Dimorphilus gyrociliatus TaxID=2664684 RepID=A0A7I8V8L4_9ANNE|nr:unnamed protein product [Dimorphilus gyrociliatus]
MDRGESAKFEFHKELIGTIEHLTERRESIECQIREDELEKKKLEQDIRLLDDRLARLIDRLRKNGETRRKLDKILSDSNAAYQKIFESSQALISAIRKEAGEIGGETSTSTPSMSTHSIKKEF